MQRCSFTGRVFSECFESGYGDVDIEFTRSGISAVAPTGQSFEISFARCELRFAGAGRRLVFCRDLNRAFSVCCGDLEFLPSLNEAAGGLLNAQLKRQLNNARQQASEITYLGLKALLGVATLVAVAYLVAVATL